MILVSKTPSRKSANGQTQDDKHTLSSSKIVSLFLRRSKKSNITNRIKKIKFFTKKPATLLKKRKALGKLKFLGEKEVYMKSHRFSKYGA